MRYNIPPGHITTNQFAAMLGISGQALIHRHNRRGKFHDMPIPFEIAIGSKSGKAYAWDRRECEAYVKTQPAFNAISAAKRYGANRQQSKIMRERPIITPSIQFLMLPLSRWGEKILNDC